MEKNKAMQQRPLHNVIVITGTKGAGKTTLSTILARWANRRVEPYVITLEKFNREVKNPASYLHLQESKVIIIEECTNPELLLENSFFIYSMQNSLSKIIVIHQSDNYKPSEKLENAFQWICLPNTQNTLGVNLETVIKDLYDGPARVKPVKPEFPADRIG